MKTTVDMKIVITELKREAAQAPDQLAPPAASAERRVAEAREATPAVVASPTADEQALNEKPGLKSA